MATMVKIKARDLSGSALAGTFISVVMRSSPACEGLKAPFKISRCGGGE